MNIKIISQKDTIAIHENVQMDVAFESNQEPINAVSGDLVYDPGMVSIEAILTGGSAVNFWIDEPKTDGKGVIHFSGMTPGGIVNSQGKFFSVVFSSQKSGSITMSLENAEVYLNDGQGTKVEIAGNSKTFSSTTSILEIQKYKIVDNMHPEPFEITRTRDNNVFNNEWFVVFSTNDKGSGIAQYELCEYMFKKCVEAKSPTVLIRQSPFYFIRVRAYDYAGNVRRESLVSPLVTWSACIIVVITVILIMYVIFQLQINKFFKKLHR